MEQEEPHAKELRHPQVFEDIGRRLKCTKEKSQIHNFLFKVHEYDCHLKRL